jgi:hypothetical protein
VAEDGWTEVWKGDDPARAGRKIDEAGIEMRIAAAGWGHHGGGIGFLSLFRKRGQARLLVREADVARARAALASQEPRRHEGDAKDTT